MAYTLNFGGTVNNTNGTTSYPNSYVFTSGFAFPNGNVDLGGVRRVFVNTLSAAYATGAAGINYRFRINNSIVAAGQMVSGAYNDTFEFRIGYSSGTLRFGRDDDAGGSVVDAGDGSTWAGKLVGTMTWSTVGTAPGSITLDPSGTSVKVSWTSSSSNGGSTATGYSVQYSKNGGAWTGTQNLGTDARSFTYTGLESGASYKFRVYLRNGVGNSAARTSGSTSIATTPGAPTSPSGNPDQITPTSMRYRFTAGSTGGSPILEWQAQRATNSGFTSGVVTVASTGASVFSGLTPNTRYYFRARGRNAQGWGPWGASVNALTLPAGAPGLAVSPSPSGTSASLTFSPPGTLPSPDGYKVERRKTGTTTPVTTLNLPGSPNTQSVSGLTPGTSYQWRAALTSGSFTSDFSAWVTAVQPRPNTSPGEFFDGSSAAQTDVTYSWDGTASNSTSKATAKTPTGWVVLDNGSGVTAVVYRGRGVGRTGSYGAIVSFTADSTTAGCKMGQGGGTSAWWSAVGAGGIYVGSIHVQLPTRSQRMAAIIDWLDGAGAIVATSAPGDEVVVPNNADVWTRLIVQDTAPAGASYGVVRAIDVDGDGWSVWKGGEVAYLDDAMMNIAPLYPYFDGNTPDTTQYAYSWLGAENASVSQRLETPTDLVDPFADPDCPPIPLAPRPPLIDPACIEEVGSWRRYWASIAPQYVLEWLAELPTITLKTDTGAERQIRIRIYENPDAVPPTEFVTDSWASEQIISYMPAGAEYVLNGVDENMTGSVDNGETWTNLNHLLYGTGATPASWPVLRCGIGYLISFDVPLEAPPGNLSIDVALTRRY